MLLCLPCLGDELPILWSPPAGFGHTLRDIAGRLPRSTPAADADLITYAHEGNHFLSRGGHGCHRIYVGDGKVWEIPTPPLVTEEVFAAIPHRLRLNSASQTIYQTYLSQGRTEYWATQPLMILDEWRAYTAGSKARQEIGVARRAETIRHMETFAAYSKVLHDLAKEIDGYDMTEMRAFCRWNLGECLTIKGFETEIEFE